MLNIQKHKFIMVNILKDIYSDISLGPLLGFKGGTCAYLFYDLPRFSTDIDLNLLDLGEKDFVFAKIKEILKKYGEIKDMQDKKSTLFFLLLYENHAHNIKVEISKKEFPNHYKLKNYLGIPMLIMRKKDMFSHKLVALLERKFIANRDLFDIWFFMKNNFEFNKEMIKLRTEIGYKEYFKKCILTIGEINEKYILQGLGEVLSEQQKIWVKENLKKELLFLFNFYLENH